MVSRAFRVFSRPFSLSIAEPRAEATPAVGAAEQRGLRIDGRRLLRTAVLGSVKHTRTEFFARARSAPPADCCGTCRAGRRNLFREFFFAIAVGGERWRAGGMELERLARTHMRSALRRRRRWCGEERGGRRRERSQLRGHRPTDRPNPPHVTLPILDRLL
jgi:hypothetical protein